MTEVNIFYVARNFQLLNLHLGSYTYIATKHFIDVNF